MPTPADIVLLARYNAVMNERLYAAAGKLDHAALVQERGAFFGSLLGTMNHIVAGDTIWLTRFAGHPAGFAALAPLRGRPVPADLRQSYGATLADLREHRTRLDGIITGMAAALRPADMDHVLASATVDGVPFRKPFGSLLLHFFNHQTHHRGQASTLLYQAGVDIGSTDLAPLVGNVDA